MDVFAEFLGLFLGIPFVLTVGFFIWIFKFSNKPVYRNTPTYSKKYVSSERRYQLEPYKNETKEERKGKLGEKLVSAKLSLLDSSYHIIHDIVIPKKNGDSTQLDHLVLSKYGIFVIETKNMSGLILGYERAKQWTQIIGRKHYKFLNPLMQNKAHINALKYLLKKRTHIHSVIAFGEDATVSSEYTFENAHVIPIKHVGALIRTYREEVFTEEQVKEMYQVIMGVGKQGGGATEEHVASLNERQHEREMKISKRICPQCDGVLIERHGKYGQFLGCANYPKCRFKNSKEDKGERDSTKI